MRKYPFLLAIVVLFCSDASWAQSDSIRVFRWHVPAVHRNAVVAEGEYTDAELQQMGWTHKVFLFWAHSKPGPGLMPVIGWVSESNHFHVSVYGDAHRDDELIKAGYKKQRVQYYVSTEHRFDLNHP